MIQGENTGNNKQSFTFQKEERLCSKKIIDKLFVDGLSVFAHPLKIIYSETPLKTTNSAQAAFAVSKKNFKKAVQRNLIKRRMREAYRLNKQGFYLSLNGKQVAVFFIFTAKTEFDFTEIEAAMKKGMKKVAALITQPNKKSTEL